MKRKWWHNKIAYQIYPKSFYDSNGDGIGDVRGIILKLDYLKELGVDILWLSPIYKSPLVDEGYDIADYYAIDPRFGTMEDVEELIAEAKKRNMYILMDLVVNHCSDQHEWFRKACEDPDGKYGKYFYIRERDASGTPATNWRSYFGGPCWEELPGHPDRQYLHVFHRGQPDLNWENPEVREEVYKNVNWWLEKGLGGFRIDAIINIKKPLTFRNYETDRADGLSSIDRMLEDARGIGVFLGEMQERTFSKYDAFSVGEVFNESPEEIPAFIGEGGYFSSMFDFEETIFGASEKGWYDRRPCLPSDYRDCVFRAQERVGTTGFLSNIIENHDEPRGVSRYIPAEELSLRSKKALACAYFLLRGIPFIYQGQEIGMENKAFRGVEEFDDISSIDEYRNALEAGCTPEEALRAVSAMSRDNARTPVQWSAAPHAGFTAGTPWLEENENYPAINVEAALADPDSLWHFYRKLIRLRKDPAYEDTFVYGALVPWQREVPNLMAYIRESVPSECGADHAPSPRILTAVNMQAAETQLMIPGTVRRVLLTNTEPESEGAVSLPDSGGARCALTLAPWQAVVLELD